MWDIAPGIFFPTFPLIWSPFLRVGLLARAVATPPSQPASGSHFHSIRRAAVGLHFWVSGHFISIYFILFFSSYSRSQQFPPLQVSTISRFLIGNNATWLHTLNFVRRRRARWTQPHPCVCMCMCVFSPSPSSRQAVSMVRHRERRGAGFWGREEEQKQGTR